MKDNTAANFTPGPWKVGYTQHVTQEEVGYICCCYNPNGQGEANTRLIAAAPELFQLLKEVLDFWQHGVVPERYQDIGVRVGIPEVRKAIRKEARDILGKISGSCTQR